MADRRKFIKCAGSLSMAACAVGPLFLINACTAPKYVTYAYDNRELSVKKIEIDQISTVFLAGSDLPGTIALLKLATNDYQAILLTCTHKGCALRPAGSIFICPCHGSEFSKKGEVLTGPAEKNLQMFPVIDNGDVLTIQLKGL